MVEQAFLSFSLAFFLSIVSFSFLLSFLSILLPSFFSFFLLFFLSFYPFSLGQAGADQSR